MTVSVQYPAPPVIAEDAPQGFLDTVANDLLLARRDPQRRSPASTARPQPADRQALERMLDLPAAGWRRSVASADADGAPPGWVWEPH